MGEFYDNGRGVYIGMVDKARKENSVAKKGEPYVWVKTHKFSSKELFKCMDDLDKKYPKLYQISSITLVKLLNKFKKSILINNNLTAKEFLNKENIKL